jgi:long-subunit fatty acid transport protein
MDRRNFALGVGLPLGGRYSVDVGYLHVDTKGRRGRIVERTSLDQTAEDLNSGFYRLNANILSLSLKASL